MASQAVATASSATSSIAVTHRNRRDGTAGRRYRCSGSAMRAQRASSRVSEAAASSSSFSGSRGEDQTASLTRRNMLAGLGGVATGVWLDGAACPPAAQAFGCV